MKFDTILTIKHIKLLRAAPLPKGKIELPYLVQVKLRKVSSITGNCVMQYLLSGRTISLILLGLQIIVENKKYGVLNNNLHISSKQYKAIQAAFLFFSRGRV